DMVRNQQLEDLVHKRAIQPNSNGVVLQPAPAPGGRTSLTYPVMPTDSVQQQVGLPSLDNATLAQQQKILQKFYESFQQHQQNLAAKQPNGGSNSFPGQYLMSRLTESPKNSLNLLSNHVQMATASMYPTVKPVQQLDDRRRSSPVFGQVG